jgi:hypothetical protein
MKLSEWARGQGVSYRTALNWFHAGTLPVSARQLPTGTILVEPLAEPVRGAVPHRSRVPGLCRKSACVAQSVTKQHLATSGSGTAVPSRRQRISPLAPGKRSTNSMANTNRYDTPCPRAYMTTSPHHSHALLHIFTQIIEQFATTRSDILPG